MDGDQIVVGDVTDTIERIGLQRVTAREARQRATELVRAGTVPGCYQVKGDRNKTIARLIGAMRAGADIGLPPSVAVDKIFLIDDRYCLSCAGALMLVQRGGMVDRVERKWIGLGGQQLEAAPSNLYAEFTDHVAADYRIWRRGQSEPYVGRYTVRDAKRAKLWANPNRPWWMNDPAAMLMWRATAKALAAGFSDHLGGLGILEEVRDIPGPPPSVTNTDFLMDAPTITDAAGD